MVADSCVGCSKTGDLDLSPAAFKKVTGNEADDRIWGTWEFIPCTDAFSRGNLKIRFGQGSNAWWYVVQPLNNKYKMKKVTVAANGREWNLTFEKSEDKRARTLGFWWKGTVANNQKLDLPALFTFENDLGQKASFTLRNTDNLSVKIFTLNNVI